MTTIGLKIIYCTHNGMSHIKKKHYRNHWTTSGPMTDSTFVANRTQPKYNIQIKTKRTLNWKYKCCCNLNDGSRAFQLKILTLIFQQIRPVQSLQDLLWSRILQTGNWWLWR